MGTLLAVAALALGFPVVLFLAQDRLIFHPQPLSEARRQEIEQRFPPVEQMTWQAEDGKRQHAWHLKGAPGRPLILYFGGNAEEVSWMLQDAATRVPGFGWLLVNYRGYGASEGAPSEKAILADALAWYDFIVERERPRQVVVFGRSLGSGAAVHLASRRPVAKVVLVTPFDSLVEVAKHHYPFLPVRWMLRHRFESARLAPSIQAPLLCVAALRDEVIPPVRARTLYEAWGGPKRWVELEGAGHNSTDGAPAFWQNIRAFLEESTFRQ